MRILYGMWTRTALTSMIFDIDHKVIPLTLELVQIMLERELKDPINAVTLRGRSWAGFTLLYLQCLPKGH